MAGFRVSPRIRVLGTGSPVMPPTWTACSSQSRRLEGPLSAGPLRFLNQTWPLFIFNPLPLVSACEQLFRGECRRPHWQSRAPGLAPAAGGLLPCPPTPAPGTQPSEGLGGERRQLRVAGLGRQRPTVLTPLSCVFWVWAGQDPREGRGGAPGSRGLGGCPVFHPPACFTGRSPRGETAS